MFRHVPFSLPKRTRLVPKAQGKLRWPTRDNYCSRSVVTAAFALALARAAEFPSKGKSNSDAIANPKVSCSQASARKLALDR